MDLFKANITAHSPLAHRMRPLDMDEFLGQNKLLKKGGAVYDIIKNNKMTNCIFFGPPGVGKTTLANIIANNSNARLETLNAVSSGVSDVKKIIKQAEYQLALYSKKTFLLLDECHRWSKAQSDSVLKAIEEGILTLLGSTTENPFVNMTPAITSRVIVLRLLPLTTNDIVSGLKRALKDKKRGLGEYDISIDEKTIQTIANKSGGDMRKAYNILEGTFNSSIKTTTGSINITNSKVLDVSSGFAETISTSGHYDMLSAFCKSIRGGDENAAIFYAHKMINSGIDPLIIARRLVVHSSEDIGLADSNALLIANAAFNALQNIGHEAIINLTHAIIYVAKTYKSDSVIKAIQAVKNDLDIQSTVVPNHLRAGFGSEKLYKNPHQFKGSDQNYLPKNLLKKIYYIANNSGKEKK